MGQTDKTRRRFIKNSVKGAMALSIGGALPAFSAKSYSRIVGANERINVGMMGVNSRGFALASNYARQKNAQVISVSDVDVRAAEKCIGAVEKIQKSKPVAIPDFRKALEQKDLDALVIAAPDHWHAPAAILAAKAGKHVYLEKPCSHNPNEGELLTRAVHKYKVVMQMGNQRRSFPGVMEAIKSLHEGIIGRPYFAKTWYANNRPSIGKGNETAVPSWLNYDLWQGPAPRKAYRDNLIHYNWHWFWNWGTGEALNNGVHMIDIARWGLKVDFPTKVISAGGRYRFNDDWQTPDTQTITHEFGNNCSITWEGRSCNPRGVDGIGVGVIFYAENGSMVIDGNGYTVLGLDNNVIREVKDVPMSTANLTNPSDDLDALHFQNFFNGIKNGTQVRASIDEGHKSTLLCQLGNIAFRSGRTLNIDPSNGHIIGDPEAAKFWRRDYEPGWEPVV
jgi:predicted dehydrogenase